MNDAHPGGRTYVLIWTWLVALLAIGMVVFVLPVGKATATMVILGIAVVKAALVARHYMHLRAQPPMLYLIVGIPVALAVAFALTLVPDIALR